MIEKPGIDTPWKEINHLLQPHERFEVQSSDWKGFLLVPTHSSQLSALLYVLSHNALPFCVQGRGTRSHPASHHALIVSTRAFLQLRFYEQGVIEVGAGCALSHLHQFLFERRQEVALEEDPLASSKQSVGGLILSGRTAGIHHRQESLSQAILGVELINLEGSHMRWGGHHGSPLAGPAFHRLIVGFNVLPAILTKVMLKTYPIPQRRLHLAWSFCQKEDLMEHFEKLKKFCSSWESLDYVLSGQPQEQSFIFAQISGLPEEMEAFSQQCPGYARARCREERSLLRNYLKTQPLNAYEVSTDQRLEPGEYLWYQEMNQKAWWMTPQSFQEIDKERFLWKQRFSLAL